MKLAFAIVYLGKSSMEVIADDVRGKRRCCKVTWKTAASSDVPPKNWRDMVHAELGFQDDNPASFIF